MAYICNSLGGNIGSKDLLNYMHQLITHGLINGLKLDYGGIIFNDLAAKLNNSVRHPSLSYARFISVILEKALSDNYVLSDEIALKIPIMGNSIFNLEPTSSEVLITCHMDRVCKSVSEACLVSKDVASLDLCDNVYDGSPSDYPNFNEIIHKVKTKTMSSLLDPNLIKITGVYQFKVVTNGLNEDVIGESAILSCSYDHDLKDDCHDKANEISGCLNEEVINQSAIHSGSGDQNLKDDCPSSGDQNLKDDCPGKTVDVSNCLSEEVIDQSAIPIGSGDHKLTDDCFGKLNELSNCLNEEVIVETIIPTGSNDHNFKVDCPVNSNEVSNFQNHVESNNQLQSESNVYMFMLSKQVSPGQSIENLMHEGDDIMNVDCDNESENEENHCAVEDVVQTYPNHSEFIGLIEYHLSSKESLVDEFIKYFKASNSSLSKEVTKLSVKHKELVDEVNKLGNSSLSNTSIDDISKAVVALIKAELESFIMSVTDLFLKTKVNINVPEDMLRVVNDIVTFKVEISNLAKNTHENICMFKELYVYFSNLQKAVNVFENCLVESIPSKKERHEDQQLLEVVSVNEALIKANISKISDSMLLLVKWAKSIFVDGSASASKTPVSQGDPQGQISSYVKVEAIHFTFVETDGYQNLYPELSNKNVESCENVSVSPTSFKGESSDKQAGTFEYEVGGVQYLMTPREIAKQKDDEEFIKRTNEEEKASYAKIVNVLAEDERNLHIRRVYARRDEEDHNLEVKYKNRKILYDKYVRAIHPKCRNHPERIIVVDIISRKGPVCATTYKASLMILKSHTPLKLSDFNYFEWLEIQNCVSTKKSKQTQVILENIKFRINELRRIKQSLDIIPGVPVSEYDPMIEFHDLMNKRKLDEREMKGSFVADTSATSIENEFIRSVEAAIDNKNADTHLIKGSKLKEWTSHRSFFQLTMRHLLENVNPNIHRIGNIIMSNDRFRDICNISSQNENVLNDITNISQSRHSIQRISQNTTSRSGSGHRRLGDSTRTNSVNGTAIRSRGVCDSAVNLRTSQTYPSSYSLPQLSESTISVTGPFLYTQSHGRGRRHSYHDNSRSVRQNLNPVGTQLNGNIECLINHSVIYENVLTPLSQIPRTHISSRTIVHQNGTPVHSSNVISSNHSNIGCLTYSSTNLDSIPVSSDYVPSVTPQSSVSLSSLRSNVQDNGTPVNLYWDCGVADHRCQHCQAVLWYEERSVKWYNPHKPKFSVCCGDGKVKLDYMREPPALLTV
ncbi:hypothetical protein Tco_1076386, partial [Tanacetum coccineum]